MPALIRAHGKEIDLDGYLASWTLPVRSVKRRGEPLFPRASRMDRGTVRPAFTAVWRVSLELCNAVPRGHRSG